MIVKNLFSTHQVQVPISHIRNVFAVQKSNLYLVGVKGLLDYI